MGVWLSDIVSFNDHDIYIFEDTAEKKYVLPEHIVAALGLEKHAPLLDLQKLCDSAFYMSTVPAWKFPSRSKLLYHLSTTAASDFLLEIDEALYKVYKDNGYQKEIDNLSKLLSEKMR